MGFGWESATWSRHLSLAHFVGLLHCNAFPLHVEVDGMGLQYTEPPSSLPRGGALVLLAWLLPKVLVGGTILVPKVTNPGVWGRLLPSSSLLKWCAQVLLLRSRTCKHVTGYRISAAAAQTGQGLP